MLIPENRSRIPDVYFSYSSDFDYRKYLEEKSHTDEIVLSVDESAKKIVGGVEHLAERLGTGAKILSNSIDNASRGINERLELVGQKLNEIDETLQCGFQTISIDLRSIDKSIENLSSVCDLGFSALTAQSIRTNTLLQELITLFKTPDQVWAREQYENAKECMIRELWEDALMYSNKSIHGDDLHSGFHIEPAFHFLKGQILMQYPGVGDGSEFLKLAIGAFADASKYCGSEHKHLKSQSLVQASWCYYCLGDFPQAGVEIDDSIKLNRGDHSILLSYFLRAKYAIRAGDTLCAIESLKVAFLNDAFYYYRASNDFDFLNGDIDLVDVAQSAKQIRVQQFDELKTTIKLEALKKLSELLKKIGKDATEVDGVHRTVQEFESDSTLEKLTSLFRYRYSGDYRSDAQKVMARAERAYDDAITRIRNHIDVLQNSRAGLRTVKKAVAPTADFDSMLFKGYAITALCIFILFATWWGGNAPIWILVVGALVASAFLYPLATWLLQMTDFVKKEVGANRKLSDDKVKARKDFEIADQKAKKDQDLGAQLSIELEAILNSP